MRFLLPLVILACGLPAAAADSDPVFVAILSRHGVRSPLQPNEKLAPFAADPWPAWEVAPGIMTAHGRRQMELMGSYYRSVYLAERLLTGQPRIDGARIFVRSDQDQRTAETARILAECLAPGSPPAIHLLSGKAKDGLFRRYEIPVTPAQRALWRASVRGRMGGDPRLPIDECASAFGTLRRILLGTPPRPAGKMDPRDLPALIDSSKGAAWAGQQLAEAVILEYTEGRPFGEVGWGRFSPGDLLPLSQLFALGFQEVQSPYGARLAASGIASHLLATLDQAARGSPVEGAFGPPGCRMALLIGHDTNLIALGRMLNLEWRIPGAAADVPLPGGALVFELRRERQGGALVVRTSYVSQTYAQIRDGGDLTAGHPPAISPIFVPDCSTASEGYDAPLGLFAAHLRAAIDPEFVGSENAPGLR